MECCYYNGGIKEEEEEEEEEEHIYSRIENKNEVTKINDAKK